MLNSILPANGIFMIDSLLICTLAALVMGIAVALIYMHKNTYTKSFVVTLALLPMLVELVILLVNGNLGTGIAVLGAFSLIRFRSVPGSAREILAIFFSMAIGLACGMGYVAVAGLFLIIVGAAMLILSATPFGEAKESEKSLRIVIPESIDYTGLLDDLFLKYALKSELVRVKTTNMGSLFELEYRIKLKPGINEKELIDDIRCRNGNLNINLSKVSLNREEL